MILIMKNLDIEERKSCSLASACGSVECDEVFSREVKELPELAEL